MKNPFLFSVINSVASLCFILALFTTPLFYIGLAITYTVYALLFNMGYDRVFPIQQAPARAADRMTVERVDGALHAER